MQVKNKVAFFLAAALIVAPIAASGQSSSINTYSPYSFYGLGDLSVQGSTTMRAMGGAGIAVRDYTSINYLNPASYSAIPRQSALFGVGLEGQNFYLSDSQDHKSSYNTFNIRDLGFQLPLANGLGLGFSITPYSSIGYRINENSVEENELTEIGNVNRYYTGSGGLNQLKLGIGWELWKNRLSLGVEMAYYFGKIERTYTYSFDPIVTTGDMVNMAGTDTEQINTIMANVGLQAMLIRKSDQILSLGLVYRMGGKMNGEVNQYIPLIPSYGSTGIVRDITKTTDLVMPHVITAGVHFARPKFSAAADYTFSTWGSSNKDYVNDQAVYKNTNAVSAGIEYTPNAMDARNYLKRCSYRIGVRYSDYYMKFNVNNAGWSSINDKAVTLGIGFPVEPRRRNFIDVGIEAGMRGTVKNNMIKENYIKFSIGFKFFGDDYWFQKYKYN